MSNALVARKATTFSRCSSCASCYESSKSKSKYHHHHHRHHFPQSALRVARSALSTTSSSDDDDDDTQESKKKKKKNIAVFISGGGSNMKAIHAACESGQINGQISVVITSSSTAGGVEWAMGRDVPVLLYPGAKDVPESERISPAELDEYLKNDYKIDVVVLAGYLRLIPPELCRTFENKMVNIHPALLPAFGGKGMHGAKVHEAVVKSGARFTGPTVHFVNENFDEGKIVAQRSIRIDPSWTADEVQRRVLKEEHDVFPEVVAALCDDRIEFREEDGVGVIVDARLGSDGKRRCY